MQSFFKTVLARLRRWTRWFQGSHQSPIVNSKVRYIASFNEVIVTRDGDYARIEYKEKGIALTHLQIGPEIDRMSDSQIVELHNEVLRDDTKEAAESKYKAFEVPLGSAQIEYFARCDQWVPKGSVLRCQIRGDDRGQIVVKIDQQELRLKQLGKLLAAYEGWGMRIEFVPENEVHRRPVVEVRQPKTE
jgi:hypothetical protein